MIISYALTGTISALLGLMVLFKAWKAKQTQIHLRVVGWLFLIISLMLWAVSSGKDRGVAIGLIVISVLALIIIAVQAYRDKPIENTVKNQKPQKNKPQKNKPTPRINRSTLLKRVLIILWVLLGCAVVAFAIALGVHELLWQSKMHASNSLVIMLFLFPILWAAFSTFSLTSTNVRLKVSVFLTPTLLSLLVLWHFNLGGD